MNKKSKLLATETKTMPLDPSNNEEGEQSMVQPGGGVVGNDHQGNKRKLPGEKDEEVAAIAEPEQKKPRAVGNISGCSQGVIAFNEKGKKYYQCKMSNCTKYAVQRGICVAHGATVKKYTRKRCVVEGCEKVGRGKSSKCVAHGGTPVKKCSVEGCNNNQKQGGKCKRHGAKCTIKKCSFSKCTKYAQRGGVCVRHGKELAAARAQAEATVAAAGSDANVSTEEVTREIVQPPQPPPPLQVAPVLPPVMALSPIQIDTNNRNDETGIAELSQMLCMEITNDQNACLPVETTNNNEDNLDDGNIQPPPVAAMPTVAAPSISDTANTAPVKTAAAPSISDTTNAAPDKTAAAPSISDTANAAPAKKKRVRRKCDSKGCESNARSNGRCIRHGGTPVKKCSVEGCNNNQKQGGKCKRHGAVCKEKKVYCFFPDCTNFVRRNGVCVRHGAKLKSCSVKGCTNNSVRRGICIKHGANSIGPQLPGAREYKVAKYYEPEPKESKYYDECFPSSS